VGQVEAFELDVSPARAVEQPDTVAEQDGRDVHEDLVEHTRIEALLSGVGPGDVDVLVNGGGLGCQAFAELGPWRGDMSPNNQPSAYLTARRELVRPQDVGLPR
jgi:hypothetical protein